MTRIEAVRHYKNLLMEMGLEEIEADAEAKHALSSIIGCEISTLYLDGKAEITDTNKYLMDKLLEKRAEGMPLAYILRERWFMGLKFYVTPAVLIPRQETELLAETAIQLLRFKRYSSVLDLCTGSGCVAVSIAKYTRAKVTAIDISSAALEIAKKNAKDIGANVLFYESDLFANVEGSFDIITANPPYVEKSVYDGLMREVKDYEPDIALIAGDRGLAFYRRIAAQAPQYLNAGGTLLLEIGDEQGKDVSDILKEAGFKEIRVSKDYSGNDRLVSAII